MSSATRPATPRPRRFAAAGHRAAAPVLGLLAACSGESPSTLEDAGAGSSRISSLWWLMLGLGVAVYLAVAGLIVLSWRRRRSLDVNRAVLVGGIALPTVILAAVGIETVRATDAVFDEQEGSSDADVVVTGEMWWWDVAYPDAGVETANEVHIPAGRPVTVELRSADVVHSFWVPELAGKIDMVPGQRNQIVLEAERPGTYRGICAEFCGLQHANMRFLVVAHEPDDFDDWLAARRRGPPEPTGPAAEGEQVFQEQACSGCHTVQGTPAQGTAGPDLTDFGAREELGAGVADSTPENLARWIQDARDLKPGAEMPPIDLTDEQTEALVAYLRDLDPG